MPRTENTLEFEGLKNYQEGLELDAAGKTAEAVEVYRSAIRLCPTMASAYFNLGLDLALLGRHEQAIRSWRKAVWLNADYRRELAKAFGFEDERDECEVTSFTC
ncbi:MAG: tetratricopeptide repeat protein [Candidatus Riflebacteria bacterium]|nr:tetratricopeptide repeat protein [Candidatus Riflebacteria bacterium]